MVEAGIVGRIKRYATGEWPGRRRVRMEKWKELMRRRDSKNREGER